ncbi:MAG TPA: hypothetical protein VN824_02275, partial [Puia sp.]|nr:hypothetical protein [Puia sp.]
IDSGTNKRRNLGTGRPAKRRSGQDGSMYTRPAYVRESFTPKMRMIYRNKGSTDPIQPKSAAMAAQRALMLVERLPFIMYLRQMRSLNKILFTYLYQVVTNSQSANDREIITPTTILHNLYPLASSRSKYPVTRLSTHKQQTNPYREQHGNQSFMYVSYGCHNGVKVSNYSLRKA